MPLPPIITPSLLASLRASRVPKHCWYYITGVTLSALNRPEEIPNVLTWTLDNGLSPDSSGALSDEEQLKVARRMRESLVKSAAIVGLPKTINALMALKRDTPPHLLDTPASPTPSGRHTDLAPSTSTSEILSRGSTLFDSIYGKIGPRVMSQMDTAAPDLGLIARLSYGYILSAGSDILTGPEVSWVLLAGLIPQDVNPQLKGHLKGAVNLGATVEEVRAVRGLVLRVCEKAGMRVRSEGEKTGKGVAHWAGRVENIPEGWTPGGVAGAGEGGADEKTGNKDGESKL